MKGERDKRLAGWWLQKRVGHGRAQGKENHILAATAPLGQILPWRIFKPLKLLIIKKNNTPPPGGGRGEPEKLSFFGLLVRGGGETQKLLRPSDSEKTSLQNCKDKNAQAPKWPNAGRPQVRFLCFAKAKHKFSCNHVGSHVFKGSRLPHTDTQPTHPLPHQSNSAEPRKFFLFDIAGLRPMAVEHVWRTWAV